MPVPLLAKAVPVRRDDEEQPADCEEHARDHRSGSVNFQLWKSCRDKPDSCDQDKKKRNLRQSLARVARDRNEKMHRRHLRPSSRTCPESRAIIVPLSGANDWAGTSLVLRSTLRLPPGSVAAPNLQNY